jgi:DNA-directed RNA polymerase specialized sigma24 family protein
LVDDDRSRRFEAMYTATFNRIMGYALRRCPGPEDAADVVAETFAIAWRRIDDVPGGDQARLWLYRVARNVLANHRRGCVRRDELSAALAVVVTAVVVAAPGLLGERRGGATSYANDAIEVRHEGLFLVARIKDPLADRERYAEAFRAVGKDVAIELVPVSSRYVGQILRSSAGPGGQVTASSDFEPTGPQRVDCAVEPRRCTLTIRISVDTTGTVTYTIGRSAQTGEPVQDPQGPGDDPVPDVATTSASGRAGGGN